MQPYNSLNKITINVPLQPDVSNRLNVLAIRNEVYNPDRFKEMVSTIVDYDMPNKNGIELINTMELPSDVLFYTFIMLTANISSPNDPRIAGQGIRDNQLINKDDAECLNKMTSLGTTQRRRSV